MAKKCPRRDTPDLYDYRGELMDQVERVLLRWRHLMPEDKQDQFSEMIDEARTAIGNKMDMAKAARTMVDYEAAQRDNGRLRAELREMQERLEETRRQELERADEYARCCERARLEAEEERRDAARRILDARPLPQPAPSRSGGKSHGHAADHVEIK
jgi:hypothetical protein